MSLSLAGFVLACLLACFESVLRVALDNAIPIEGWINDPTDNDLLHLMPLLEGLQYVTDVRALLALRGGEDGKHM